MGQRQMHLCLRAENEGGWCKAQRLRLVGTGKVVAVGLGRFIARLGMWMGLVVVGCSAQPPLGYWEGPATSAVVAAKEWDFGQEKGQVLQTQHYRVFTTIQDKEVAHLLPEVMEGALAMYRQVAPDVAMSDRPLDCYMFRCRPEWDTYTQRYGGSDARVYLQIRSGGYTLHDRYVAYYIGRSGTFSVAAHEGWHQFAGRHFKGRVPPFLEEGLACMFEAITWKGNLPRWNLSVNGPRAQNLRKAIEGKYLWPLDELCAMHAGDIVGEKSDKIDAFYAQAWAFARFMWEGEGGKHREELQKWLGETAAGTVYDPSYSHRKVTSPWNRRAVGPMVEHYLEMDMKTIDQVYQAYIRKIAYEEIGEQMKAS